METFQKWNFLVPELREHSLSYFNPKELFQYAQCSKVGNSEIQRFNTIAPWRLCLRRLKRDDEMIMINLKYSRRRREVCWFFTKDDKTHYKVARRYVDLQSPETHKILEGNARDAALQFLSKQLKYVKTSKIRKIKIDFNGWPFRWGMSPAISQAPSWDIRLYPSMFEECMNALMENSNIKKLHFRTDEHICIPSEFSKSNMFKKLDKARIFLRLMIQDEDFLASKASYLFFACDTVSNNAINRKIWDWYDCRLKELTFAICFTTRRIVNEHSILFDLPFEQENFEDYVIRRSDGKNACVTFYDNSMTFIS